MRNRDSHHLRLLDAAAFLASVPVQGALAGTGIYRYVDAQGVAHFTDSPRDGRYQRVAFQKPRITTPGAAKAWQLRGRRLAPHPTTSGAQWDRVIGANAREQRIQPALVKALIKAESNFDPTAVAKQGAQGLMQLMPTTAALLGVADPMHPEENVWGGTRYLRAMLDRFGDVTSALAAYNAGPTAVDRYGGVPPYPETEDYVQRVLTYYRHYHGDFAR